MSEEAKHSPGPWRWARNGLGKEFRGSHLEDSNGVEVFSVDYGTPVENGATQELIRAAPAMLAMLRELEWEAWEGNESCCPSCKDFKPDPKFPRDNAGHRPDCRLATLLRSIHAG